jgi:glycosyltransferase involved in cell wall biosynthesis
MSRPELWSPSRHGKGSDRWAVLHTALGRVGGAERQLIRFVSAARSSGIQIDIFYCGPEAPGLSELGNLFPQNGGTGLFSTARGYLRLLMNLRKYRLILIYHHLDPLLLAAVSALYGDRSLAYVGEPLRPLWEEHISGDASLVSPESMSNTVRQLWGPRSTFVLRSGTLFNWARKVLRAIDRASMRRIRSHVTNSSFMARAVKTVYDLDRSPEVVYQGVPLGVPKATDDLERTLIVNVGAFLPMKDQATLVRAWAPLEKIRRFDKFELVFVGDGPLLRPTEDLVRALKLRRVRFLTAATDSELQSVYQRAAVLVHCALAEPFGMTPVEAAEYGVASIVSNSGGLTEFVQDGRTGWLFEARNVPDLSTKLMNALDDPIRLAEVGKNARQRMCAYFSIDQNVKGLLAQMRGLGRPEGQRLVAERSKLG